MTIQKNIDPSFPKGYVSFEGGGGGRELKEFSGVGCSYWVRSVGVVAEEKVSRFEISRD